jgi:predicted lipid-binding transport protein (Tim44 family)
VVSIVIFAMVAAFLGMRLYAVLGKRTGHEQPLVRPADDSVRPLVPVSLEEARDAPIAAPEQPYSQDVEAGLRAIGAADRSFNTADFIGGAKSAYKMILEAFWAGKEEDYAPYVAEEVRSAFAEAIEHRTTQGHVLDNRMVAIERAVISDAKYANGHAEITVQFDADIAAVTRDTDGKVVAGSLTDAVPTHDAWTFTREVRSDHPNWILTDTDESA